MSVFKISGSAKRTVNYDVAVIVIEFLSNGRTAFAASSKTLEYCESFLAKVEKIGIAAENFTLVRDVVQEERYRDDDNVEAIRSIQVKIPFKMETINAIRDILDNEKYDSFFELKYELSNEEVIRDELLKEALLDSKQKADQLADTLVMKVVGIESVEVRNNGGGYYSMDWMECEQEDVYRMQPKLAKSNELKAKEETLMESIEVKWNIE